MTIPLPTGTKSAVPATEIVGLAHLFRAAAEPLRLMILRILENESFGVQELARIFAMPQPGISHHLRVLLQAGLVETRREGNMIFYRRPVIGADTPRGDNQRNLFETLDRLPWSGPYRARIGEVHQARAQLSREYFRRNSGRFTEKQALICVTDQYRKGLLRLLDGGCTARGRALEIGPGDGGLLEDLAERFEHLVAVDNSPEMLARARQRVEESELDGKVTFLPGEPERALEQGVEADLVVMNMVLHHIPSPADALRTVAGLMAPAGTLLLAELCPHSQDWVREECGDLWLGFDSDELATWGKAAGLSRGQGLFIGLKNGFQVQLRLFHKE